MDKICKFLQNQLKKDEGIIKILDVGTGRGEFLSYLFEINSGNFDIHAIDTSEDALKIAEEEFKGKDVHFYRMDANNMLFNDDEFDFVILSNSLHHIENPSKIINEMKRVTKEDGILIFNEMFSDNQSKEQLSHVYLHHFNAEYDREIGKIHNETYKKNDVLQLIEGNNLKICDQLEYMTDEEQECTTINDTEFASYIDNIQNLLKKRIEVIEDVDRRREMNNKLDNVIQYIKDNGFKSSTELILSAKKEI